MISHPDGLPLFSRDEEGATCLNRLYGRGPFHKLEVGPGQRTVSNACRATRDDTLRFGVDAAEPSDPNPNPVDVYRGLDRFWASPMIAQWELRKKICRTRFHGLVCVGVLDGPMNVRSRSVRFLACDARGENPGEHWRCLHSPPGHSGCSPSGIPEI